ncbi:DUF1376 domain-containing protein [uncultured Brevundimonas sp.]|uniref:YdaU family protein n=1 Tax=uncultured Brevundimonas sp. TaxID=213418 RepID=UPI002619469D|nr:DUF1376 domain-containing protein [uncultured Brevundimonas sp.]
MSQPFMQLYVADYLGDTRHLTTEQHGAYLLLLMTMWRAEGRLPNCDKKLARIVGATASRWAKIKADVLEFFEVDGESITNKRLMFELKKASEKSIKRAEAGTRGGEAKALKDNKARVANASDLPCHSSEPEPDNSYSPKGECQPKPDPLPVREAFDLWNQLAARLRLPVAKDLTDTRRTHIRARLTSAGIEGWMEALAAVEASPMCRGENDRGWRADLDFVCQPKSFAKLREGSYAPCKPRQANAPPAAPSAMSAELQAKRRAMLEAEDA